MEMLAHTEENGSCEVLFVSTTSVPWNKNICINAHLKFIGKIFCNIF